MCHLPPSLPDPGHGPPAHWPESGKQKISFKLHCCMCMVLLCFWWLQPIFKQRPVGHPVLLRWTELMPWTTFTSAFHLSEQLVLVHSSVNVMLVEEHVVEHDNSFNPSLLHYCHGQLLPTQVTSPLHWAYQSYAIGCWSRLECFFSMS